MNSKLFFYTMYISLFGATVSQIFITVSLQAVVVVSKELFSIVQAQSFKNLIILHWW